MPEWIKLVYEAMNKCSWAIMLAMLAFLYWPETYLPGSVKEIRASLSGWAFLILCLSIFFTLSAFVGWIREKFAERQHTKLMIADFNHLSLKEREIILGMYFNNEPTISCDPNERHINKLLSFGYLVDLGGMESQVLGFGHNLSLSIPALELLRVHGRELLAQFNSDRKAKKQKNAS